MRFIAGLLFVGSLALPALAASGLAADSSDAVSDPTLAEVRKAAEGGDREAQTELASKYFFGEDVKRDFTQAVTWFRRAAEQGQPRAQHMLAMSYYSGRGVERDVAKAAEWWRKAAEQGLEASMFWLGQAHEWGQGVQRDLGEAARWYRKAADVGHPSAQTSLGDLYKDGLGVKPSAAEAIAWYRKAAEQKSADGQYKLGQMYLEGRGVARDESKGAMYLRLSSEQGFTAAMLDLSEVFVAGRGEKKNLVCAYFWAGFAAIGWDFAAEKRDELEPRLSAVELTEARRLIQSARSDADGNVERGVCPGEEITLSLSNAKLPEILNVLRHLTRLEVIGPDTPKAADVRLRADLKDTPWEEAITQLLASGGLSWKREGSTIRIAEAR